VVTAEGEGNRESNEQRREDETWGHFTRSQYYRGKHNYVVRLFASQSTIFRAGHCAADVGVLLAVRPNPGAGLF
jgi:hypothetical protein